MANPLLVPIVRRVAIGYNCCSTALDWTISCRPSTKDQGVAIHYCQTL
jgi:hypothetical protein